MRSKDRKVRRTVISRRLCYGGYKDALQGIACMRVCLSLSESLLSLCKPVDCCPAESSVQGIIQAIILEWVAHSGAIQFSSIQFSHSVMSNSLRPYRLQHARPPCTSPTPRVYSNSCPLSRRCHPTISSSVVPFSSCLQSFPASGPVSFAENVLSSDP